jgi:hypothetical protein
VIPGRVSSNAVHQLPDLPGNVCVGGAPRGNDGLEELDKEEIAKILRRLHEIREEESRRAEAELIADISAEASNNADRDPSGEWAAAFADDEHRERGYYAALEWAAEEHEAEEHEALEWAEHEALERAVDEALLSINLAEEKRATDAI